MRLDIKLIAITLFANKPVAIKPVAIDPTTASAAARQVQRSPFQLTLPRQCAVKVLGWLAAGLLLTVPAHAVLAQAQLKRAAQALPSISSPQWAVQHWSPDGKASTLASHAAHTPTHPASITKLLTAYTVLQAVGKGECALSDVLTVSPQAAAQDGTRVGYTVGERVALQDALQGMLAISGNDAAWALAEHVGALAGAGASAAPMPMPAPTPTPTSASAFIARMNAVSAQLGLNHSQWHNPHGLTQDGHTSTAADLAALAHALWTDFPQARAWLGVKTYTWNGVTQSNRNSLLWRDASVDGLKTGHTEAAGYNLAASSIRTVQAHNNRPVDAYDWRISSVVLGAASAAARATDSAALLAWARAAYAPQQLVAAGQAVGNVAVSGAVEQPLALAPAAVWVLLPTGQPASSLRHDLVPLPLARAPVAAGAAIATLHVYDGAQLLASTPLVTQQAIDRAPWYRLLWQWVKSWLKSS
jgi:serine-type D-Ala-D-Ala carboxypeptidase (penicillin-binding protein 5/6)